MEFKFSCKLFEIGFSGDPGFVESQLEKYQPYVLLALQLMEKEAIEATQAEKASEVVQIQPRRERPAKKEKQRWDRKKKDNASQRIPPRNNPGHQTNTRMKKGNDHHPPPPLAGGETGEPAPPDPEPESAETRRKNQTTESINRSLSDDALSAATAEFPSRRRAPRIRSHGLNNIVEQKKPRTHHARIMVYGYYMQHDGGGSDFTVAELKRCYRESGQDPGTNIEKVISHATRSGFIISNGKGNVTRYRLSNKGRRYVEDGLKLS